MRVRSVRRGMLGANNAISQAVYAAKSIEGRGLGHYLARPIRIALGTVA